MNQLIENIVLAQQVRLARAFQHYEPLIKRADGAASWPLHPHPDQIENGAALKGYDLEFGVDRLAGRDPRTHALASPAAAPEPMRRGCFRPCRPGDGIGGLETICGEFATRFRDTWGKCF